jgi:hypothetical protein
VVTVATEVLSLDQVMLRSLSTLPDASSGVAIRDTVLPMTTEAELGATITDATGTGVVVAGRLHWQEGTMNSAKITTVSAARCGRTVRCACVGKEFMTDSPQVAALNGLRTRAIRDREGR